MTNSDQVGYDMYARYRRIDKSSSILLDPYTTNVSYNVYFSFFLSLFNMYLYSQMEDVSQAMTREFRYTHNQVSCRV